MDNQLPTAGVEGSGKSGMVVVVLVVLAALALGAFYMLRSGGSVTEEMPAIEDGVIEEAIVVEEGVGGGVGAVEEEYIVAIKDFKFTPATITMTVGESVTWKNDEAGVPHSIILDDGSYKSAAVFAGETETRRFPVTGTYPYHCGIHPSMRGTVVVR